MNSDYTQHAVSEFLGTFALVFVGSGAIMINSTNNGPLIDVALAHGLVLGVMCSAFMRISAHFNPAVTAGFLFTRRIGFSMAVVHWIAQFAGAIAAAYALKGIIPAAVFAAAHGGGQTVTVDINGAQAWAAEAIGTFFLVTAVFGTAVDERSPKVGGFGIGLMLACVILVIGPLTGSALNPARSFGPAMAYGVFEAQGIYLTAPVVGAVIAALLYDRIFLAGTRAAPTT